MFLYHLDLRFLEAQYAPKITKTKGIFKKDYLHIMVFEVFRQFFGFGP